MNDSNRTRSNGINVMCVDVNELLRMSAERLQQEERRQQQQQQRRPESKKQRPKVPPAVQSTSGKQQQEDGPYWHKALNHTTLPPLSPADPQVLEEVLRDPMTTLAAVAAASSTGTSPTHSGHPTPRDGQTSNRRRQSFNRTIPMVSRGGGAGGGGGAAAMEKKKLAVRPPTPKEYERSRRRSMLDRVRGGGGGEGVGGGYMMHPRRTGAAASEQPMEMENTREGDTFTTQQQQEQSAVAVRKPREDVTLSPVAAGMLNRILMNIQDYQPYREELAPPHMHDADESTMSPDYFASARDVSIRRAVVDMDAQSATSVWSQPHSNAPQYRRPFLDTLREESCIERQQYNWSRAQKRAAGLNKTLVPSRYEQLTLFSETKLVPGPFKKNVENPATRRPKLR